MTIRVRVGNNQSACTIYVCDSRDKKMCHRVPLFSLRRSSVPVCVRVRENSHVLYHHHSTPVRYTSFRPGAGIDEMNSIDPLQLGSPQPCRNQCRAVLCRHAGAHDQRWYFFWKMRRGVFPHNGTINSERTRPASRSYSRSCLTDAHTLLLNIDLLPGMISYAPHVRMICIH